MPTEYTIKLNARQALVVRVALRKEMASRKLRPPWKGVWATAKEVLELLQDPANRREVESDYRSGLCGNREDHEPHTHESKGLGRFFCHADQSKRLPFAMERKGRNG
jgi:hypothetical protein